MFDEAPFNKVICNDYLMDNFDKILNIFQNGSVIFREVLEYMISYKTKQLFLKLTNVTKNSTTSALLGNGNTS